MGLTNGISCSCGIHFTYEELARFHLEAAATPLLVFSFDCPCGQELTVEMKPAYWFSLVEITGERYVQPSERSEEGGDE